MIATTATTEVAWKQAINLALTSSTLRQLAADLSLESSRLDDDDTTAQPGAAAAAAGCSAAAEQQVQSCCQMLHERLRAARTSLTQSLEEQYARNVAMSSVFPGNQASASAYQSCCSAVNSARAEWLIASVRVAAHRFSSDTPGVAEAGALLQGIVRQHGAASLCKVL